uniref:Protein kinase domain-containing protein n=1 Tax=Panagrolaimus sp. ES5 TaxID=591445 RepID=A0AC34G8P3_9BILA
MKKKVVKIIKSRGREAADTTGERRQNANILKQGVSGEEQQLPFVKEFKEGDIIEKYTVISKLGEGSYGAVYKVEREKEKYYALKIAHSVKKSKDIEKEASILKLATEQKTKLNHLCKYIDSGTYDEHYAYVVMSLVGKDLCNVCGENGEFSKGTALIVAKQTLIALKELHNLAK